MFAYDFDGTIYDGDCSLDFYKFCLKKKKKICFYWFKQAWFLFLYILGFKSKTEMKEVFFCFLKDFEDIDKVVSEFWDKHYFKVKKWYLDKNHDNDVVISASPEFLLKPICERLGIKNLIGSVIDKKNGRFLKENCYGEEKVKRFEEVYGAVLVLEMYTDSISDEPMIRKARNGFMVKGNNIIDYDSYVPSLKDKLKKKFFSSSFIRFIFTGVLNTICGVLLSFLFSLVISNVLLAFVCGYLTSLIISYLLNSFITFKDYDLSFRKFIMLCVSYIPNFLIQFLCVYIFATVLGLYKLWAYIIAAVIGVPITYVILSILPFRGK